MKGLGCYKMSFLYRPHRRLLADAMDEVVELKDKADLILHIKREWSSLPHDFEISEKTVQVEKYGFDDRINWDTYVVLLEMDGKPGAIGFTNGPALA